MEKARRSPVRGANLSSGPATLTPETRSQQRQWLEKGLGIWQDDVQALQSPEGSGPRMRACWLSPLLLSSGTLQWLLPSPITENPPQPQPGVSAPRYPLNSPLTGLQATPCPGSLPPHCCVLLPNSSLFALLSPFYLQRSLYADLYLNAHTGVQKVGGAKNSLPFLPHLALRVQSQIWICGAWKCV